MELREHDMPNIRLLGWKTNNEDVIAKIGLIYYYFNQIVVCYVFIFLGKF